MTRQIFLNFIANNDVKIALYMSTISVGSNQQISVFLFWERIITKKCVHAVKGAVREEPGTSQKRICVRELTTAVTNSNHPDPNQLSLAMSTTRQLQEAVAQRWIAIVSLLGIQMEFFISDIMQQCFIQYVLH